MKEFVTTITQRGQVTIPAEIRRLLGVKPKDKVAFTIEDSQVRLVPAKFTLETAFASVKPLSKPEDFKRISREAREEHVDKFMRKLRQQ